MDLMRPAKSERISEHASSRNAFRCKSSKAVMAARLFFTR